MADEEREERQESETERILREQVRALQDEARRLQEEARKREERGERDSERSRRGDRDRDRDRGERRRDGRGRGYDGGGGYRWTSPSIPPMPPAPPMPPGGPLPPIPGAGGTFTPYDPFGVGAMFGMGPGPGPRRHRGRGRAGRGDVRITILILLDEGPANGYQLMQEIEQRTGGAWKPSSGSIYPALQQLEDEGIVQTAEGESRRKEFALTDEGREYVRKNRASWTAPWEGPEAEAPDEGAAEEAVKIRDVIAQLAMAYMQVLQVGTEAQRAEAARVLVGARQALYRILAGDTEEG